MASHDLPPELEDLVGLVHTFSRAATSGRSASQGPSARAERRGARAPASYVVDRHGARAPVRFDLITERNEALCSDPTYGPELLTIDAPLVTAEVVRRFRNGMTTRELDSETAAICIQRSTHHSDYEWLAARIHVNDLQKRTPAGLTAMIDAILAAAPDRASVQLSDEFIAVARRAEARVAARLDLGRDYRLRFFGYQTIARSYLLRPGARQGESSLLDEQLMERPQHLYMRVALGVFVCRPGGDGAAAPEADFNRRLDAAFEFYDALSLQRVSNATPTMLNAGTNVTQLSSCFQLATGDDLPALYDTLKDAALASKWSGGVSVWLHNIRAEGAPIRKTRGRSTGIKRYVRLLNDTQLYVDQGGNRPGAFAVYLGVDHDDIFTFLAIARRKGEEALKGLDSPDLKYALWVPDLFMEAVVAQLENDARVAAGGPDDPAAGDWHLFDPDASPGLHLAWGEEYRALVARYVAEGRYRRRVKAGDIIAEAFKTWAQAGVPYVLYKDSINRKSNMRNVAPICSSNLCVAGSTLVLTDRGHLPIAGLVDREVNVWNGAAWSAVVVRRTSAAASLVRVELFDGGSLDCTPYHKFYLCPDAAGGAEREVRAGELAGHDELAPCPAWPGEPAREDAAYLAAARLARRLYSERGRLVMSRPFHRRASLDLEESECSLDDARRLFQCLGFDSAPAGPGRLDLAGGAVAWLGAPASPAEPDFAPLPLRRVRCVTPLPGEHPTYCFTEPLRNRGVFNGIYCGNCCEITIPSWSDFDAPDFARFHPGNGPKKGEFGVCNLAAICLESFLAEDAEGRLVFDWAGVIAAAGLEVRALNRVIDLSFYPSEECWRGNRRHRPVGVGIMGLADVLARLGLAYGSPGARAVARGISAAVYYGALLESTRLADAEGPYSSFAGSPLSEGKLQPDLWVEAGDLALGWEEEVAAATGGAVTPAMWAELRERARRGARNAYVTADMPTATTSNIAGQNECFEPFTSNLYTRRTLAGEFYVVNRHLMAELGDLGLWDEPMRRAILAAGGSVQGIEGIPAELRRRYLTARELHPSLIILMAKAMAPFICQSMSMNVYFDEPDLPKILRFLVEGWREGLKTGMYYCHTRPAAGSQKIAARPSAPTGAETPSGVAEPRGEVCSIDGNCTTCSV